MPTIATLAAKLTADPTNFNNGLEQAAKKSESVSQQIKRSLSPLKQMNKAFSGLEGAGIGGILGLAGGGALGGFIGAKLDDQLHITEKVFGGVAEAAKTFWKEVTGGERVAEARANMEAAAKDAERMWTAVKQANDSLASAQLRGAKAQVELGMMGGLSPEKTNQAFILQERFQQAQLMERAVKFAGPNASEPAIDSAKDFLQRVDRANAIADKAEAAVKEMKRVNDIIAAGTLDAIEAENRLAEQSRDIIDRGTQDAIEAQNRIDERARQIGHTSAGANVAGTSGSASAIARFENAAKLDAKNSVEQTKLEQQQLAEQKKANELLAKIEAALDFEELDF